MSNAEKRYCCPKHIAELAEGQSCPVQAGLSAEQWILYHDGVSFATACDSICKHSAIYAVHG